MVPNFSQSRSSKNIYVKTRGESCYVVFSFDTEAFSELVPENTSRLKVLKLFLFNPDMESSIVKRAQYQRHFALCNWF